jgi:hypothetical protein
MHWKAKSETITLAITTSLVRDCLNTGRQHARHVSTHATLGNDRRLRALIDELRVVAEKATDIILEQASRV